MPEFLANLCLEIPSDVPQQEVWDLEKHLKEIEEVKHTDLRESRDLLMETVLYLQIALSIAGPIITLAEGAKAIREIASIIYKFVHMNDKRYNVTIRKNGKHIEIKNMSIEDIERLIGDI